MRLSPQLHDAWAGLLAYPDERGSEYAAQALQDLELGQVTGSDELTPLREFFKREDINHREELYTQTFDGSDDRALEVGWHVHGENYARGALMVRLRKLLGELDLFETSELPDHIGVVLGLIGRLDEKRAGALARGVVLPALRKLIEGFGDSANPYRSVFTGLQSFLTDYHGEAEQPAGNVATSQSSSQ